MRFRKLENILIVFNLILILSFFLFLFNPTILGKVIGEKNIQEDYSPSDFLTEDNITIEPGRVILQIGNANISRYNSSDSMIPFLNENSNGIVIVPKSYDELEVGDVITFEKEGELVVHRIIEKGIDQKGGYFITQGDNMKFSDYKVRFSQIRSVIVAIVY